MIIGIGSDLCDVRRIRAVLERHGDRFRRRIFTATELARAQRRPLTEAGTLAKRWAAKEAGAKALGQGLINTPLRWRDLGVVNSRSGQPMLQLTGSAEQRLHAILPAGHVARIHLTMTDDGDWAQAFVVIEAVPAGNESR